MGTVVTDDIEQLLDSDKQYSCTETTLYSTTVLSSEPTNKLYFFSNSIVDYDNYLNSHYKNFDMTNMQLRGQLPRHQYFAIDKIILQSSVGFMPLFEKSCSGLYIGCYEFFTRTSKDFFYPLGYPVSPYKVLVPCQNFGFKMIFPCNISLNFDLFVRCDLHGRLYNEVV